MTTKAPRKPGYTLKAPNSNHLYDTLDFFNINMTALGEKLGVGKSTVSVWTCKNESPLWSVLACEGLVGRSTIRSLTQKLAYSEKQRLIEANDDRADLQADNDRLKAENSRLTADLDTATAPDNEAIVQLREQVVNQASIIENLRETIDGAPAGATLQNENARLKLDNDVQASTIRKLQEALVNAKRAIAAAQSEPGAPKRTVMVMSVDNGDVKAVTEMLNLTDCVGLQAYGMEE
jgi:hypothetical protein